MSTTKICGISKRQFNRNLKRRIEDNSPAVQPNHIEDENTFTENTFAEISSDLLFLEEEETFTETSVTDLIFENLSEDFIFPNNDDSDSDTDSDCDLDEECINQQFISKLAMFIIKRKLSREATDELLVLLHDNGMPFLPKSAKTLLKTPKNKIVGKTVFPGEYWHFGIEKSINAQHELFEEADQVDIDVCMDGVPLVKSSKLCMWPILGAVVDNVNAKPFVIGCYVGYGSPKSSDDFLNDFALELSKLEQNGIKIESNSKVINFSMRALCCDAPARAFISNVRYHTSFHGCSKCNQVGYRVNHTNVFCSIVGDALRSDESFSSRRDLQHHNQNYYNKQSVLEKVGVGMVSQIPIDPMHLIDLGVVKKCLLLLLEDKFGRYFLSREDKVNFKNSYASYASYTPSEFCRRPRTLEELPRFKATEFRLFILYLAPVVLKKYLTDDIYQHFLLLHCAVRLLYNPNNLLDNLATARQLLIKFVSDFAIIYSEEKLSYNIHMLLHLVDCVEQFGCLDSFSNYKFENHMQILKKMIRKPSQVLQQLVNRIHESEAHNISEKPTMRSKNISSTRQRSFGSFVLNNKLRDNHCMLKNGSIVEVKEFDKENKDCFYGYKYNYMTSFFENPINSMNGLGIVYVQEKDPELSALNLKDVYCKCMRLPYEDGYACIPLLHHL